MDRALPKEGGVPAGPGRVSRACSGRAGPSLAALDESTERRLGWVRGEERPHFNDLRFIGQFDRSFLLCEAASDLFVLDQHAAHERVMFERLRARGAGGDPAARAVQRLLVPELLEMDRPRVRALAERAELLAELGVEVSAFGEHTVALQGVPAGVSAARVRQGVHDLADEILAADSGAGARQGSAASARAAEALRYELAALLACHSAVRAHDPLDAAEVRALFQQLDAVAPAWSCPHGRPILVRFPRDEVARWFVRD
jgi:DNA mismatch repair protein MutL